MKLKIGVIGPSSDVKKLFAEGQRKERAKKTTVKYSGLPKMEFESLLVNET